MGAITYRCPYLNEDSDGTRCDAALCINVHLISCLWNNSKEETQQNMALEGSLKEFGLADILHLKN